MLRFPLNTIRVQMASNGLQYYFCILRPSHPPLYFNYPIGQISEGVAMAGKYLCGYCHLCDSCGENCKDGRKVEDRPKNLK